MSQSHPEETNLDATLAASSDPDVDFRRLAETALDAAIELIQRRVGATTGDLAAAWFSGPENETIVAWLARYARIEAEDAKKSEADGGARATAERK